MNDAHPINSVAWWNDYFRQAWVEHGGREQTRHFMQRLLAELAPADRELLPHLPLRVLDWGCALGEGVAVLAEQWPQADVTGMDVSEEALRQARAQHPRLRFVPVPPGEPAGTLPETYDVVVNSNSLEHFADWLEVLRANLQRTRLLHLTLVPYCEEPLSVHHRDRFDETSFPAALDGFTRLYARPITVDPEYWPSGRQLLVAYASAEYLQQRGSDARAATERAKWDAYYANLPAEELDEQSQRFNAELTALLRELLPTGGRVLEAGAGGGNQSIALAQAGFEVSLLDFSRAALDYARANFGRHGLAASFIEADAFQPSAAEFDLVFNAGVLEHYTLGEQTRFLHGMASRSRRYVLALIPNRACYWYWIWRSRKTADADWPFGKEVPQTTLQDAFEAAGLRYLGQTFIGEAWTEYFIESVPGIDAELRAALLALHRSPVVPALNRGYLIAALGAVDETAAAPAVWVRAATGPDIRGSEEWAAIVADALAGRIGAEQALAREAARLSEQLRLAQAAQDEVRAEREALRLTLATRHDELNVAAGKLIEVQRQVEEVSAWGRSSAERAAALAQEVARLSEQLRLARAAQDEVRAEREALRLTLATRHDELNVAAGKLIEVQRQVEEVSVWGRSSAERAAALAQEVARLSEQLRLAQAAQDEVRAEREALRLTLATRHDELNVAAGKLIEVQRQVEEVSIWGRSSAERAALAEQRLAQAQQAVSRTQEALEAAHVALAERDATLAERDATLADRDATLAERDQQLMQLNRQAHEVSEWGRANAERVAVLVARVHEFEEAESRRIGNRVRLIARVLREERPAQWARRVYRRLPLSPAQRHRIGTLVNRWRGRQAAALGTLSSSAEAPTAAPAGEVVPPPPRLRRGTRADVFVFAVIDWHFRIQRPQQIARALAERGHRVFYLSNHFVDAADSGYAVEALDPALPLYQVALQARGAPPIYFKGPAQETTAQLRAGLAALLLEARPDRCIGLVDHAWWWTLANVLPNCTTVYDCMDHHEGFGNVPEELLQLEQQVVRESEILITTSDWLAAKLRELRPDVALVRNACDPEHFRHAPPERHADPHGRRTIGYFGAIAEWFDVDLVRAVARSHPEARVLLVGNDTVDARGQLADCSNVEFTGEVPYASLPGYVHAFDVCLLPFKVIPLTLATNPVKVYEYLAAGKPVVAVELPEMRQFGDLVRTASHAGAFVAAVGAALHELLDAERIGRRQDFAASQSWRSRADAIEAAIVAYAEPRISVVVLTWNNIALTQTCLASLQDSDYPNLDIIIVDNASTDGSRDWLAQYADRHSGVRLILNDTNAGFAAGNNVGLRQAEGEFVVVLNNDTQVTPGWARTMVRHFRLRPRLGLLGPVTNNIGNEAKIDLEYQDQVQMRERAAGYTLAHPGVLYPLRTAAFFCVMLRKVVLQQVGGLSEDYGMGFFEDDDYCRRVEAAGWEIACADDVFVHHELSASFGKLPPEERQRLFERNLALYESKWGKWQPHRYRGARAAAGEG